MGQIRHFQTGAPTSGEEYLHAFKGARSAPGRGWPPMVEAQRAEQPTGSPAANGPFLVTVIGKARRAGRRLPILGPPGHVGVGAHSAPWSSARTSRRKAQRWRTSCTRWPPLRRSILKPCVLTVKGAPEGASQAIPSGPWTAPPAGIQRRLSEGWLGPSCVATSLGADSNRPRSKPLRVAKRRTIVDGPAGHQDFEAPPSGGQPSPYREARRHHSDRLPAYI